MHGIKTVHLVGIGGIGMVGIASVLLARGYTVTGSDLHWHDRIAYLDQQGARVFKGHAPDQIGDADVVVISSAVPRDNLEVLAAHARGVPVISRAEMLAELIRWKRNIIVTGTHGKTTTTSVIASMFLEAGLDPSFVVGGVLQGQGITARWGNGNYAIVEADESDASFLKLSPLVAVVTNIDSDHLGTYNQDLEQLKAAFIQFLHRLPFYGKAIVCLDCPVVRSILPLVQRPLVTYGFHPDADYRAFDVRQERLTTCFTIQGKDMRVPVRSLLPGAHNVANVLAAFAVGREEGLVEKPLIRTLETFEGVGRRFHLHGVCQSVKGEVLLVEDYGHHPAALQVTIETAQKVWPERRLVMAFQPHRYTRTQELLEAFAGVLSSVPQVLVVEVYSAGEAPIAGADGRALCQAICARGGSSLFVPAVRNLPALLDQVLEAGDVLLLQGAGDIGTIVPRLQAKQA